MEEKKKKENEELNEEELDKASGGSAPPHFSCFICGGSHAGYGIKVNNHVYCAKHAPKTKIL